MAEVEVLSDASNAAIVRMPGRRFPGVVLQGDSLRILYDLAADVLGQCKPDADEDLQASAEEMVELLRQYVLHYEATLKASGMELPYSRALSELNA
jgi:hypothetical protein